MSMEFKVIRTLRCYKNNKSKYEDFAIGDIVDVRLPDGTGQATRGKIIEIRDDSIFVDFSTLYDADLKRLRIDQYGLRCDFLDIKKVNSDEGG